MTMLKRKATRQSISPSVLKTAQQTQEQQQQERTYFMCSSETVYFRRASKLSNSQ